MGERVGVLDDLSFGNSENLAGLDGRIEMISGNLTNPSVVRRAMTGVNVVFADVGGGYAAKLTAQEGFVLSRVDGNASPGASSPRWISSLICRAIWS